MHEEKRIRQILIRNTFLFFIVFALIFSALGVLVYQTVSSNVFRSADQQLTLLSVGTVVSSTEETEIGETGVDSADPPASFSLDDSSQIVEENPQFIYIFRDKDGSPLDIVGLYSSYPDYIESMPFDPALLNEVYSIDQGGHHYRAINTQISTDEDGPYYLQAIVNVDAEVAILQQFTQTLVIGLVVALILCAAASYFLSKRTIKPIAEAWKKQTEFVQNASHELRTPLAVISVTQELLLEDPHARIIDHFEDISLTLDETRRLTGLTEDLLLLTSIDSDSLQLEKYSFELDRLLIDTLSLYEEHAAIQGKSLAADAIEKATLSADRDKIRQVLNSLIDNALKYTETGDTISLSTQVKNGKVAIIVADTGIGVSEETIAHAFDRFYREDKARTRVQEGLGLGLSIACGIVDAHQGTIEMKHNEPKGTIVVVTLPLAASTTTSARGPAS